MTAKSMLGAAFLFLAAVALPQMAAAATHNVGDSFGWTMPLDSNTYSDWASTKTFYVGDVLVFNFMTGEHDVTEVTKAGFDSCSSANPISSVKTGPARITLSTAGSHHFICSFPTHCNFDQKLSITVRSKSSTPPATAPSSPRSSPPHSAHSPLASPPTAHSPLASPPTAHSPLASPPTAHSPLASPPTAYSPRASPPIATPPSPNSGNSLSRSALLFSAGLAIAVALML